MVVAQTDHLLQAVQCINQLLSGYRRPSVSQLNGQDNVFGAGGLVISKVLDDDIDSNILIRFGQLSNM
jgi:hypothetical protein